MDNEIKVTALKDGPLMVEGKITMTNQNGDVVDCSEKTFLCRCGASNKKPFCDGSHKKINFDGSK